MGVCTLRDFLKKLQPLESFSSCPHILEKSDVSGAIDLCRVVIDKAHPTPKCVLMCAVPDSPTANAQSRVGR
jgi:hypothetical protein